MLLRIIGLVLFLVCVNFIASLFATAFTAEVRDYGKIRACFYLLGVFLAGIVIGIFLF